MQLTGALWSQCVKGWSSCIRNARLVELLGTTSKLVKANPIPREGDIVAVRVVDNEGAYREIDRLDGTQEPLSDGDIFVGVLAHRTSGTNLTGVVPPGPLVAGDRLHLL